MTKNTPFIKKLGSATILFLLLFNLPVLFAQKFPITLDTAFLCCEYKTNYYMDTLTTNKGLFKQENFILQIGKTVSKYYSKNTDAYERMCADPIRKETYMKEYMRSYEEAKKRGEKPKRPLARHSSLVIFHKYPKGKSTVMDAVFLDHYIFEDDDLPQQWTIIADSVKTILHYSCKKAVCSYRGRNYEAWYSPDLPINGGPWKFLGLPGLIMSAQDTKGHYTFEIIGLMQTKEPIEYIEYDSRKYTLTDRISFLRMKAKASQMGMGRYMQAKGATYAEGSIRKTTSGGSNYDLMERDYYTRGK